MVRAFRKADLAEQGFGQLVRLCFLRATHANRAKGDVIQRAHLRKEMKLLKHHARFLTNQALINVRIVNLHAIHNQIATGDLFQLIDAAQQG